MDAATVKPEAPDSWILNLSSRTPQLFGGSWVVISGGYKSPNMAYKYSYPNNNPIYNYP